MHSDKNGIYCFLLEMYSVNTEEEQVDTHLTFLKFLAFAEICQLSAVTLKIEASLERKKVTARFLCLSKSENSMTNLSVMSGLQ
jgi:hypothetical protein